MKIAPLEFYKNLADDTRLKSLLLIHQEKELCVCELTESLQVSQPKISRHLAQLREAGMLLDRREGQWVYYRINPDLPQWALEVLSTTTEENSEYVSEASQNLCCMGNRPLRRFKCC